MPHKAFGTTFTWNSVVAATLTSINGIEITASEIDDTTHQSPDGFTQSSPGLRTAGDIALAGYFSNSDTTGQHAMVADAAAGTKRASIITFPTATGATWTMASSWIKSIKVGDADMDGNIPFTATIKPDGKPVFAVAASAGLTTTYFAVSESAVINPAPAGNVYTYVATVLTAVASVTVTPVATAGVITVNGNVVATGQASSAITLGAAGSVTPITIVVTETNKAPKTYTIYLSRA